MDYDSLQGHVAARLIRDDLGDLIPDFIRDAEAEFNRELMVPEREAVSITPASGATLALPSDFWSMRSVYIDAGDYKLPLDPLSLSQMQESYSVTAYTGTPRHFAIQGLDLVFGPAPDQEYTVVLSYYQSIPALGDLQPTNWLLETSPDLYLNAVQWLANVHMKDWQTAAYFKSEVDRIIDRMKANGRRKTHGVTPRPYGVVKQVAGAKC